ncbi:hypothetical protein AVEN_29876-1 [Araneus ventricosus]|uniref:Uncharacterized protein n=1 Tax=Araneus ventricosus TaxID=182803 RepID=A0A4Y2IMK2_ARAVE|nr:hypothetical protein AVEN_29876-1 [Araneus ventricosus]
MTEIEERLISSLNKNTDKVEVKHQAHLGQAEEELKALLDTELDDLERKEQHPSHAAIESSPRPRQYIYISKQTRNKTQKSKTTKTQWQK